MLQPLCDTACEKIPKFPFDVRVTEGLRKGWDGPKEPAATKAMLVILRLHSESFLQAMTVENLPQNNLFKCNYTLVVPYFCKIEFEFLSIAHKAITVWSLFMPGNCPYVSSSAW